jgi:hypothetical protein
MKPTAVITVLAFYGHAALAAPMSTKVLGEVQVDSVVRKEILQD